MNKTPQLTRGSVINPRVAREVLYLIQGFDGCNVRTYRTENPARALTLCRPYAKQRNMIQITVWLRVGENTMIPMSYVASSERDVNEAFQKITRDIACALESTQIDEERNEQREEASHEIPSFATFPEFMCESGEALER